MKTTGRFLLGFIAGALAGATLGLLMAPEKGDDTRKLIVETIEEYSKKGKEFIDSKRKANSEE
jgi:gas vesicle protein